VRIYPAFYGKWGEQTLGTKPRKLDALEWYPTRLQRLKTEILEEQVSVHLHCTCCMHCLAPNTAMHSKSAL
jgi:hypothetical protein